MNACPTADVLLGLLAGELTTPGGARIETHIEHCEECRVSLERLTRGAPVPGREAPLDPAGVARGAGPQERKESDEGREVERGDGLGEAAGLGETVDLDTSRTDPGDRGTGRASPDRGAEVQAHWPIVPGYDILEWLGEGGMGVVYKARHLGLNRPVALKMIRGGSQARSDSLARFRAEAEMVARLRHPNIIQIYDIGEADGLPFVGLELLDGGSLSGRLAGNPQPGRAAAELVATLAHAVHAAHAAGIVHRDLKPSNVLFGADGVPRITDFGLAKRLGSDSNQTETGAILGSPSYMAPEQARGHSRDVGPTADVHALGAILYEMLTGRPPFKGETSMETIRQVVDDDPVPPSRLMPRVALDLETICLKCLNKEPSRRYDSALTLAEDLERHLAGEPIRARRTPLWERGAKWAGRRPATAALLAVGAVAVVLMVAAGLHYNHRLGEEVRRSRAAERQALEQRNLAPGAYEQLVFDVQDPLGDKPATRSARQSLLDTAIGGLDRLAAGAGAAQPDLARAVAHHRLGVIYRQVGRAEEARRQLEMASRLAEGLFAASPHDLALASCLRDVNSALGEMHIRVNRAGDALPLLRRAVALGEAVVAAAPDRPGARQGLIEACFHCGRAFGFIDEPLAAEPLYRRMRDLAARWVEDEPASTRAKNFLAISLRKLGDSRKLGHDPDAARVEYAAAIDLGRALLGAEPQNPTYQSQLATSLEDLATIAMTQRRPDEAHDLLQEAERLLLRRCEDDPEDLDDQVRLILVHYRLGCIDRDASRFRAARGLFVRALDRVRQLEQQGKLDGMAAFRDQWTGVLGRAIADCDGATALRPGPPPGP